MSGFHGDYHFHTLLYSETTSTTQDSAMRETPEDTHPNRTELNAADGQWCPSTGSRELDPVRNYWAGF